jgi:hypothetical protein
MIYKFCEEKLDYIRVSFKKPIIIASTTTLVAMGGVSAVSYYIGRFQQINSLSQFEREVLVLTHEEITDPFSEDKFTEMLKQLNVKFPYIATAQSMLETGDWSSDIFKENNNLFGMKEAKTRVTTSTGTMSGHAYYNHWRESVYDYAFYQSRYLSKLRTEEEYFNYLANNYAEDSLYISKLKNLIIKHNLKERFN